MPAHLSREERLNYINEILSGQHGFPPFTDQDLGRAPDKPEILNLIDVQERGENRIEAKFLILDTDGDEKEITKMLGGTIIIVLPIINERTRNGQTAQMIQMSMRWRFEFRGWSVELPHGLEFDRNDRDFGAFDSPAHRIMTRTFGSDFMNALSPANVMQVHELFIKNEYAPAKVMLFAAEIIQNTQIKVGDGMRVGLKGAGILSIIDKGETEIERVTVRIRESNSVATLLHAARRFPKYFA